MAVLLVSSSLICSNAKAQYWGYGGNMGYSSYPSYSSGGYGGGFSMGYPSYSGGYGGGYSTGYQSYPGSYGVSSSMSYPSYSYGGYYGSYPSIPMPVNVVAPVSTDSTNSAVQVSRNSEYLEEFITDLQEKYPDLEGIDWDGWEDWTDEDWDKLNEALSAERNAETLAQYKAGMVEKWDAYDLNDWEEFNNNWNTFIVDAIADDDDDDEIGLTWSGFRATYGCFDSSDPAYGPNPDDVYCWKTYSSWPDKQWKDFRGLYNKYLEHEWRDFYQTLQDKMNDYNTVDWENWRSWTDADWESCLTKVNSGNAKLVTGSTTDSSVGYSSWWGTPSYTYSNYGYPSVYGVGYPGYYGSYASSYSSPYSNPYSNPQIGYGNGIPSFGHIYGW